MAKVRRKTRHYHIGDAEGMITASQLRCEDRDTQLDVMRDWFHQHFEDPVENTPYESAEGGYQYIWGGPFNPREELESEFGGIVREDAIEQLAEELMDIAPEWTGHSTAGGVNEYIFDSIAEFSEHLAAFHSSLDNIEALLAIEIEEHLRQPLLRLLYANVITALETYLSGFFISSITGDSALLRKFVEQNPDFKAEKIPLSAVFSASEQIEQKVKTYLVELVWHALARVKAMYRAVLNIDFPPEETELFKAVLVRHDLVHRNGKSKDGQEHTISEKQVRDLIGVARTFVTEIERRWEDGRLDKNSPF